MGTTPPQSAAESSNVTDTAASTAVTLTDLSRLTTSTIQEARTTTQMPTSRHCVSIVIGGKPKQKNNEDAGPGARGASIRKSHTPDCLVDTNDSQVGRGGTPSLAHAQTPRGHRR